MQKTALITGAAKRLGRAMAIALANEGMNIVIHYHSSKKEAKILAEELEKDYHVKTWLVCTDLSKPDKIEQFFRKMLSSVGKIDILINNASIFVKDSLSELTLEQLEENFCIHSFSPLMLGREFAKQPSRGVIVNFLDAALGDFDPKYISYTLSKQALFNQTRMMALDFAPNVRVNAIAPGAILPPVGETQQEMDQRAAALPLRRAGCEKNITDALLFLIKHDYLTGQVLFVDGGRHLLGTNYVV